MDKNFVIPLADPRAILEVVGGKGASLARLAAAGFPVPDGFHVTTEAYRGVQRRQTSVMVVISWIRLDWHGRHQVRHTLMSLGDPFNT